MAYLDQEAYAIDQEDVDQDIRQIAEINTIAYQKQGHRPTNYRDYRLDKELSNRDAVVYAKNKEPDKIVVGYRGTDLTKGLLNKRVAHDLTQNALIVSGVYGLTSYVNPLLQSSIKTAEKVKEKYKQPITISGHSRGGNLAEEVGIRIGDPKDKIISFNAARGPLDVGNYILRDSFATDQKNIQRYKALKNDFISHTAYSRPNDFFVKGKDNSHSLSFIPPPTEQKGAEKPTVKLSERPPIPRTLPKPPVKPVASDRVKTSTSVQGVSLPHSNPYPSKTKKKTLKGV